MAKPNYSDLHKATRGAVFVVVNVDTERAAAYFGGSVISVYDLGGAHVDTFSAPLWGTAASIRQYCLKLLGKGACDA